MLLYRLKYWEICIFDVTHPILNPIFDKFVLINFFKIRAKNMTFWGFCVFQNVIFLVFGLLWINCSCHNDQILVTGGL